MKVYFFAFSVLLLQIAVFPEFLSFQNITPDILTVFVIIFTLKNDFFRSIKLASFIGILQDLLSPLDLVFNTTIKIFIASLTYLLKDRFNYTNIVVKGFFLIFIIFCDIFLRSFLLFLKTGIFEIPSFSFFYILVNFILFYIVVLKDEYR
ncbi:hypothetical protein [Persephonella sp.]